jgi:hypothetical protein
LFLEKTCFADKYPETGGNAQKQRESAKLNTHFRSAQKRNKGEAHLHATFGPKHWRGRGLGPPSNQPEKDDGEEGQLGCGRTLGLPTPPPPPLGPILLRRCH